MEHDWKSYLCNVNDKLASILVDLSLRQAAPISGKDWLLWVWVHFKSPRPDGLSDSKEAPILYKIEDRLSAEFQSRFGAILSGRITTRGRREFYYYGEHQNEFSDCTAHVMTAFEDYRFDCGLQLESNWNQYLNVLYPSDEQLERIKNRDVLDVLERQGDVHSTVREVSHWIYFQSESDRDKFLLDVAALGYRVRDYPGGAAPHAFGIVVYRDQGVTQDSIDEAVIGLFRLANRYDAEYDGWETPVEKG